jgi:hypothetical protein
LEPVPQPAGGDMQELYTEAKNKLKDFREQLTVLRGYL